MSARQFAHKGLVDQIAGELAAARMTGDDLEIEITESLVMQNPEQAVQLAHALKALGISISIDDFGTGFSSLAYLKRFPVDSVKIDRAFIKEIPSDVDDMAITKGIIALGHSLRLKVIAEGVEKAEQFAFLAENECDELQGYIFSKPLTAAEFATFHRAHKAEPARTALKPQQRLKSEAEDVPPQPLVYGVSS